MDVLLVRWVDSSFQHGWRGIEELKQELAEIVSVGILAQKDKEKLVLMLCYDKGNENFADGMVIPMCAVKSIKKIAEVEK